MFTAQANERLIAAFVRLSGLPHGARVADLGCGSGVFTELLRRRGYTSVGLDISPKLVALGRRKYPGLELRVMLKICRSKTRVLMACCSAGSLITFPTLVLTGFSTSEAPFVLVYPADDDYNAGMLDAMVTEAAKGCDIVCASRFMPGGSMVDCPLLKALLVRAGNFTLYHIARLPTHDASNGFRLFSRRVLNEITIESDRGFCYSLELLVKCHRLGWRIGEVPARWFQRAHGASRFQVIRWLPDYLRWYAYAFATTYLRRPAESVSRKPTI